MNAIRLKNGAKLYGPDLIREAVSLVIGDDGFRAEQVLKTLEAIIENDLGGWTE
jgi:hypothetical protein